jgi:tetratricopeptide (TPR) repeat protein
MSAMRKPAVYGLKLLGAVLLGLLISFSGSFWGSSDGLAQQVAQSRLSIQQTMAPPYEGIQGVSDLSLAQQSHRGRALYESGQIVEAIALWQQLAQTYAAQQNSLAAASALTNLSLSYQQLAQWDNAQIAIAESLALIAAQPDALDVVDLAAVDRADDDLARDNPTDDDPNIADSNRNKPLVMARALMAHGSLKLALGQPEQALEIWQQAADTYRQSGNQTGYSRAQINQAQALRELGFYRQALEKLTQVAEVMKSQQPSLLKAIALRRLGEALRLSGQLSASETSLTESLEIAQHSSNPTEISTTLLSLGRTAESRGDLPAAQNFYTKAADTIGNNASAAGQVPVRLAQLALHIKTQQWSEAIALGPVIQSQFKQLPPSRLTVYHQINWAESLLKLAQAADSPNDSLNTATLNLPSPIDFRVIDQQLRQAVEQARTLLDTRAEAYALGTLGRVYEQNKQWEIAQQLTQRALSLSSAIAATDMAYQWQWQLGRLWKATDNPQLSSSRYALSATR